MPNLNSGPLPASVRSARVVIALVAAAVLAFPAAAQQGPPDRIGNIWDSLPHQPTQADVGAAEQERGLARTGERDRAIDSELDQLGRMLLQQEGSDPALKGR